MTHNEKREELMKEFKEISDKLIEFLNKNYYPHVVCIIDTTHAAIYEGDMSNHNEEFIQD